MNNNFLLGTDVSLHEYPIDFQKMKSAGVKYTIVRAGQNLWVDPYLTKFMYDSKIAGMWRGTYWFWDSRVSPEEQAELWISSMKGDYGELGLFADYEEKYGGVYGGAENFKKFLEKTKELLPSKEIIIYTGYWYWRENVPKSMFDYFSQYKLWVARYEADEPLIPEPFKSWDFWQFSEEGSGSTYGTKGGRVDLNYFNGTEEDFVKRFNLKEIPSVVIPDKDSKIDEKKLFDGINYKKFESYPPSGQGRTLYHVVELDSEKVEFFVSPQLSSRMYVPHYLKKYNLDVAINGDGFISTTIAGYAVSEGRPYGKKGIEQTLYVNKSNVFTQTPQSPAWNAISYPNLLVKDGKIVKINKTRDDIRGRSALGFTKDQEKVFLLAVDGKDYWSKDGMNFWEVAQVMIDLGCDFAVMLDGGGSTTLSAMQNGEAKLLNIPCGEDDVSGYEYPMRRVANVFGVRAKNKSVVLPEEPHEEENDGYSGIVNIVLSPVPITTKNKGGKVKYKVLEGVKSRKTPSMYQTTTKTISAGTEFFSEETKSVTENISGLMVEIKWAKMEDGYWIPFLYKGVQYLEEVGEVEIPVDNSKAINVNVGVDEAGKLYIVVTDPNETDVAKVLINGKEYKV
jgi:GH25 family lysozyme M1 (1,4-beta-N-acetylmuramidase)